MIMQLIIIFKTYNYFFDLVKAKEYLATDLDAADLAPMSTDPALRLGEHGSNIFYLENFHNLIHLFNIWPIFILRISNLYPHPPPIGIMQVLTFFLKIELMTWGHILALFFYLVWCFLRGHDQPFNSQRPAPVA